MAKASREASKSLKQRFKNQATAIIVKNKGVSRSGKVLSEKEIGRRSMARAERMHAAASSARDKVSKKANVRAFASKHPTHTATATKTQKNVVGKSIRRARTGRNENPSTGKKQTALKAGRVAVKASVRQGITNSKQGGKALAQLKAMDPTSRRSVVGEGAYQGSRASGQFQGVKGNSISHTLQAIRKQARKAGKK